MEIGVASLCRYCVERHRLSCSYNCYLIDFIASVCGKSLSHKFSHRYPLRCVIFMKVRELGGNELFTRGSRQEWVTCCRQALMAVTGLQLHMLLVIYQNKWHGFIKPFLQICLFFHAHILFALKQQHLHLDPTLFDSKNVTLKHKIINGSFQVVQSNESFKKCRSRGNKNIHILTVVDAR